jgi:hypothetical protein
MSWKYIFYGVNFCGNRERFALQYILHRCLYWISSAVQDTKSKS